MIRWSTLLWLALFAATTSSAADPYPAKPVRIVVPYSPGGSSDLVARIIAQQLSEDMPQSFVVENRTGAGSTIGSGYVANAAPDGYTLLLVDFSFALAPSLYPKLSFNIPKDFTPIAEIGRIPAALVVHPSLNVKSVPELVAYAKANPGKLNYGSAGIGGAIHLATEVFNRAAGVKITHVPFAGGGGAMMSGVVGNHVQMVLTAVPTVLPFVTSGKLTALAVTTADGKRSAAMPDVPSMSEAGLSGMTVYFWYGLAGPAGLPPEVVKTVYAATQKALANPKVREQLEKQGAEISGTGPEEFTKHINAELSRWSSVIKDAGIKAE